MVEMPNRAAFPDAGEQSDTNVTELPVRKIEQAKETDIQAERPIRRPGRSTARSLVLASVMLSGVAFGTYAGYDYWTVGRFTERTNDAYVKADVTSVAPKVAGYIKDVLINDNDRVRSGQVLARIDDRDYQAALRQAKADLKAAEASIANVDAQIDLQRSAIDQAQAALNASRASLEFATSDAARSARLNHNGVGTQSRVEQSASVRQQALAAVERDQAALVAAQNKIPVLTTQRQQGLAQRDRADATVHQAELNLSYTAIVAAVDGTIGARTIRVGQYVTSGAQLMAIVPLDALYVVANYKETQLTHMHPGQHVEVRVDSFPDLPMEGRIDSLSPASGSEFSLLPPDNATGNFTKVVQRIPVKILIDDERAALLRAGMSVVARVDTRSSSDGGDVAAELSGDRK